MKLVIGIVRPEKANDVLEALYRAEVRGVSMSRVQGHGGELDRVETYRGTTVKIGLSDKVRFEIAVSDYFVQTDRRGALRGRPDRRGRRRQDLRPAARAGGPDPHRRDRRGRRDPGGEVMSVLEPAPARPGRHRRHRLDAHRDGAGAADDDRRSASSTPAWCAAKNTLNTFMMCVAAIAIAGVTWALIGYSLAFDGEAALIGGLDHVALQDVDFTPARRDDDPAPGLLRLPGNLLHHHRGADLRRRGRADALRRLHGLRGAVVGARLRGARPLGVRRRLADRRRHARLRRRRPGRDGLRVLGAGGRAGRRSAQRLRPPGAPPPQRRLRPARRRPALVRLVRLQRRQRLLDRKPERARLHQHAADPGLRAASPGSPST